MNNRLNQQEKAYLERVKSLSCGVCDLHGPSEAHHIKQGHQFTAIPLCPDCHRGWSNGIHGQQRIWKVYKKTELSVLNDTIARLIA